MTVVPSLTANATRQPLVSWLPPVEGAARVRQLLDTAFTRAVMRGDMTVVPPWLREKAQSALAAVPLARLRGSVRAESVTAALAVPQPPAVPRPASISWYVLFHLPDQWQEWIPLTSKLDGRLTTPTLSLYDEPSPVADAGLSPVVMAPTARPSNRDCPIR